MLSGNSVSVRLQRGSVLAPGSIKCVPGEGMPKRQNPHLRGDLVIRFAIDFPESISEATAARIATAFETGDEQPKNTDPEQSPASKKCPEEEVPPSPNRREGEVYLSDFDMEQFGKTLHQEAKEAYDDDEEEQAQAAAKAAQAAQAQQRYPFYSRHGGYGHAGSFGGFAPPGNSGANCQQM